MKTNCSAFESWKGLLLKNETHYLEKFLVATEIGLGFPQFQAFFEYTWPICGLITDQNGSEAVEEFIKSIFG